MTRDTPPAGVAIVVVNYHSQELIGRLLDSLAAQVRLPYRVVVVDNSETPDTVLLEQRFPAVVVLRSEHNLGFAGGCNRGIDYALERDFSFILLLNPDTRAEDDFLSPLVQVLERYPAYGMVGPKIYADTPAAPRSRIWNCGGKLNWWLGGQRRLLPDAPPGVPVQPVSYLSGCALLLRSQAVREVGLMDERYFLYFEDLDYVQRFLRAGWRVGYVHGAELIHQVSATTTVHSPAYVYYFARNRVWFMRRWARRHHLAAFLLYTALLKMPAAWLYFGLLRRRPGLASTFCRGAWEGLSNSGGGTGEK